MKLILDTRTILKFFPLEILQNEKRSFILDRHLPHFDLLKNFYTMVYLTVNAFD